MPFFYLCYFLEFIIIHYGIHRPAESRGKSGSFFLFVQGNLKCLLVCKIREIVRVCHCSGKFEMLACCEIRDIFECVMI